MPKIVQMKDHNGEIFPNTHVQHMTLTHSPSYQYSHQKSTWMIVYFTKIHYSNTKLLTEKKVTANEYNGITIGKGVHQVRVSFKICTYPVDTISAANYYFAGLYKNGVQYYKNISRLVTWTNIGCDNLILDVTEGDVLDIRIFSDIATGTLVKFETFSSATFGLAPMTYFTVEVLN